MGQLPESLPVGQRLARYRQFADEAFRRAAFEQDHNLRAGFVSMAAGWDTLAAEIERAAPQSERH